MRALSKRRIMELILYTLQHIARQRRQAYSQAGTAWPEPRGLGGEGSARMTRTTPYAPRSTELTLLKGSWSCGLRNCISATYGIFSRPYTRK